MALTRIIVFAYLLQSCCSLIYQPVAVTPVEVSTHSLSVLWRTLDGNARRFIASISPLDEGETAQGVKYVNESYTTWVDLIPGKRYTVAIVAESYSAELSLPAIINVTTVPMPPFQARASPFVNPVLEEYTVTGNRSMRFFVYGAVVLWQGPDVGHYDGYEVVVTPPDGIIRLPVQLRAGEPIEQAMQKRRIIWDLVPGVYYDFTVRTTSDDRLSDASSTGERMPPEIPSSIKTVSISTTSVTLSWNEPHRGILDGFVVEVDPPEGRILEPLDATTKRRAIAELTPGTRYKVDVYSTSFGILSFQSRSTTIKTPPNTPIGPVNAPNITSSSVIIEWRRPTGNLDYYEVVFFPRLRDYGRLRHRVYDPEVQLRSLDADTEYSLILYSVSNGVYSKPLFDSVWTAPLTTTSKPTTSPATKPVTAKDPELVDSTTYIPPIETTNGRNIIDTIITDGDVITTTTMSNVDVIVTTTIDSIPMHHSIPNEAETIAPFPSTTYYPGRVTKMPGDLEEATTSATTLADITTESKLAAPEAATKSVTLTTTTTTASGPHQRDSDSNETVSSTTKSAVSSSESALTPRTTSLSSTSTNAFSNEVISTSTILPSSTESPLSSSTSSVKSTSSSSTQSSSSSSSVSSVVSVAGTTTSEPPFKTSESPSTTSETPSTTSETQSTKSDPPSTKSESLSTTSEPPSTTSRSTTELALPQEKSTSLPNTAPAETTQDESASSTSEPPSTTLETPSKTSESSNITPESPSTRSEPPSTKSESPSTTSETPSTKSEPPSTKSESPSTTSETPSTKSQPTSIQSESPSTTPESPLTKSVAPSTSRSSTEFALPQERSTSLPNTAPAETTPDESTSTSPSTRTEFLEFSSTESESPSTTSEPPSTTSETPFTKSEPPSENLTENPDHIYPQTSTEKAYSPTTNEALAPRDLNEDEYVVTKPTEFSSVADVTTTSTSTEIIYSNTETEKVEVEATTTPQQVQATTTSQQVEATTTSQQVEATTTSQEVEATTTPQEVEATTTSQQVEATTTSQQVEATTTSQQVEATTTSQQVEATTTSQQVEATTTSQQVEATTTSQQVEVTTTSQQVEATTTSQQVEATTTSQQVEATTTSQQVEATTTSQQVEATTTSQQVEVTTTSQQVEATTTSQQVEVTTTSQQVEATTTSQQVEATTTSQQVEATTTSQQVEATTTSQQVEATTTYQHVEATTTSQRIEATTTSQQAEGVLVKESTKSEQLTTTKQTERLVSATTTPEVDQATDSKLPHSTTLIDESESITESDQTDATTAPVEHQAPTKPEEIESTTKTLKAEATTEFETDESSAKSELTESTKSAYSSSMPSQLEHTTPSEEDEPVSISDDSATASALPVQSTSEETILTTTTDKSDGAERSTTTHKFATTTLQEEEVTDYTDFTEDFFTTTSTDELFTDDYDGRIFAPPVFPTLFFPPFVEADVPTTQAEVAVQTASTDTTSNIDDPSVRVAGDDATTVTSKDDLATNFDPTTVRLVPVTDQTPTATQISRAATTSDDLVEKTNVETSTYPGDGSTTNGGSTISIETGGQTIPIKNGFQTICKPNNITVLVDKSVIAQYEQRYGPLHLNDAANPECRGVEHTNYYRYTIAPNILDCGTRIELNETHVNFTNTVSNANYKDSYLRSLADASGVVILGNRLSRLPMQFVHMRIWCTFPLDLNVSAEYPFLPQLTLKIITFNISGHGEFSAVMQLYKTADYAEAYLTPPTINATDTLYVGITLLETADESTFMTVRRCWGTPTRNSNHPQRYPIIEDYCPVRGSLDGSIRVYGNGEGRRVRWEGSVFKFISYDEVWLHCEIKVCFGDNCNPNCGNTRRRRSSDDGIIDDAGIHILSAGPVVMTKGSSRLTARPTPPDTTTEAPRPSATMAETSILIIVAALSAVIVISCIIIACVVARLRRHRRRHKNSGTMTSTATVPFESRGFRLSSADSADDYLEMSRSVSDMSTFSGASARGASKPPSTIAASNPASANPARNRYSDPNSSLRSNSRNNINVAYIPDRFESTSDLPPPPSSGHNTSLYPLKAANSVVAEDGLGGQYHKLA